MVETNLRHCVTFRAVFVSNYTKGDTEVNPRNFFLGTFASLHFNFVVACIFQLHFVSRRFFASHFPHLHFRLLALKKVFRPFFSSFTSCPGSETFSTVFFSNFTAYFISKKFLFLKQTCICSESRVYFHNYSSFKMRSSTDLRATIYLTSIALARTVFSCMLQELQYVSAREILKSQCWKTLPPFASPQL